MHASISKFTGDSDDLLRRYDAMVAEVPQDIMRMHLCLRAPDIKGTAVAHAVLA